MSKAAVQPASTSGVIWITGFSASGKTTIGRKVEARLRALGQRTVFLDGDDLRSILGAKWGYSREERVDLAHVYFRLCSHLASQGCTVIISAVAMFKEVSEWARAHIAHFVEVYLDVPDEVRRLRDTNTKKVYAQISDMGSLYDEPSLADIVVDNHGDNSPEVVAERIVVLYCNKPLQAVDMGRHAHWNKYYAQAEAPGHPSGFAESVQKSIKGQLDLLEVGCGNGRDAAFFARNGNRVTALDLSAAAIEGCINNHRDLGVTFRNTSLPDVEAAYSESFGLVYSRFVLHAMPLTEELLLLKAAYTVLRPNGFLQIECRSINDPMARQGKVISPTERIHGHYRRFIVMDELIKRLTDAGFVIVDKIESLNLATHGKENPVVIRVCARKPENSFG